MCLSVYLSVCLCTGWPGNYLQWGRDTYLGKGGVSTLDGGGVPTMDGRGRGTYLGWDRVPTLDGRGRVPTLDGEGYLPWMGGEGYLPWMGEGYGVHRHTYHEPDGRSTYLGRGTYHGQVMLRVVHLLQLSTGGLSCLNLT